MKRRALLTMLVCGLWASSSLAQVGPERLRISPQSGDLQGLPISSTQTQQFTAFLGFFSGIGEAGGEQDVTGEVTWVSSNKTIADFTGAQGQLTALQAGTITVTAISGTTRASTTVVVLPAGVTLASIAVSPLSPSVAKGIPQQFAALGTYSDSSTHNVTTLAGWTSSNNNVATIGAATGLAQTVGLGNSTITATVGAVAPNSTTLTVTAPIVVSVVVTPQKFAALPGATVPYAAMAAFSDHTSQNVTTNQAVWSSSNPNAATIGTSTGIATALQGAGGGVTTISAAFGGKTGSATLTVPALTSILVTPANQTISPGTTKQFSAIGTYSDGRTQVLTNVVTWSATSNPSGIVTINSSGLATANMTPNVVIVTIKAMLGIVSGTTTLTVGAGQTVTSCQTLGAANTAYVLLNDVTATGTCFVITKDNITLNLNGHNITYATSPQTKPAFGIAALTCTEADATAGFCGGTFNNPTIFGPPATPGSDPPSMIKQGAGAFGSSDAIRVGSTSAGVCNGGTLHDFTTMVTHPDTTVIGNSNQKAAASIHFHFCQGPLTIFNVTTHNSEAWVVNRSNIEGPDIRLEAWTSSVPINIFNNNFSGGGQGGIFANESPGASIHDNTVGAAGHVVQDFAIFAWGSNDDIFNNTINCLSCRGIMLGGHDFHAPPATGQQVHDNDITVHMLQEYCPDGSGPCAAAPNPGAPSPSWGCEPHGTYGIQFDDGVGQAVIYNNTVTAIADQCDAETLRVSKTAPSGVAPDSSHNNVFNAVLAPGHAASSLAIAFGTESDGAPTGFTSTRDTFKADTYNFFGDFQGADQPQVFNNPTIVKGDNPDTSPAYTTFAFHNGAGTGNCVTRLCPIHWFFIDPVFLPAVNGASKDSNDMLAYTGSGSIRGPSEYFIQWTFALTVVNGSSAARPGLSVTIKNAQSNQVFSGTTDANGKISTVLTEFRRANFTPPGFTPSSVVKQIQTPHTVTINGCNPSLAPFSVDVSVLANLIQTKVCN